MEERLNEIRQAHVRLRDAAAGLSEGETRAATDLPGWTRGHLLAHLGDLSKALARQARYAKEGKVIEVYDGGRPGRDKSIETGSGQPIEWLREHVNDGFDTLEEAWSSLEPGDWERRCGYRDQALISTQFAWWREVELHSVDLGLGYRPADWSLELSGHVLDFLESRLPEDFELAARDTGRHWGKGTHVIHGDQRSLAAWIAGRTPTVMPEGSLPELGPWP